MEYLVSLKVWIFSTILKIEKCSGQFMAGQYLNHNASGFPIAPAEGGLAERQGELFLSPNLIVMKGRNAETSRVCRQRPLVVKKRVSD